MVFVSGEQEDYSIILEYQSIGVHAVTHEPTIWNRPCIYCQISQPADEEDEGFGIMCGDTEFETMETEEGEEMEEDENEEDENEEEDCVFEILFSPIHSEKSISLRYRVTYS